VPRLARAGTVGRVAAETDAWKSGNLGIWGTRSCYPDRLQAALQTAASCPLCPGCSHTVPLPSNWCKPASRDQGSPLHPPSLSCCLLSAPGGAWILPSSAASSQVAMQARQVRAVGCSGLHDSKKHCLHRSVLDGSTTESFRAHFTASRRHIHLFLDSSWAVWADSKSPKPTHAFGRPCSL
jgi:hypothetical protein